MRPPRATPLTDKIDMFKLSKMKKMSANRRRTPKSRSTLSLPKSSDAAK